MYNYIHAPAIFDVFLPLLCQYQSEESDICKNFKMKNMMREGNYPALENLKNVYARYDADIGEYSV